MANKLFWKSRTFWANIIAIIVMLAQSGQGFIIGVEYQLAILALINLGLRAITGENIVWKK